MLVRPIVYRRKGERTFVPAWLADPDGVAPCICGRGLMPGEPYIVLEGEHEMKRWFHMPCFEMIEDELEEEWDDEEE